MKNLKLILRDMKENYLGEGEMADKIYITISGDLGTQ